jgi:HEAT repeat protein
LEQLAWLKDPEGVTLAAAALGALDEGVRGAAATALGAYGSPMADRAKPALLAALKTAGPESRAPIAWALVELGDVTALAQSMELYRAGHFSQVQRLGGGAAFDVDKLALLIGNQDFTAMARDPSPTLRQLAASALSRVADPRHTDVLVRLLGDQDQEVAMKAAPGLVKIGNPQARAALLGALRQAKKESRTKYLTTLRDDLGAQGLVLALESVATNDRQLAWYQTQQIFDLLKQVDDPRVGEWLLPYLTRKPHVHWATRAATAMARVGDVRAVPFLAKRLRLDPLEIYSDRYDWEMLLKRDDTERVVSARLIADLAQMHPGKREEMRQQAEDALIYWLHEMPAPHANGMRALAALGSTKDLQSLRKWANPEVALPVEGQQPPMPDEWVIAGYAMRYAGVLRDPPMWSVFEKTLERRPKNVDVTMESLMQGGLAILGMSLRALGKGAADGLSEWGDPKGFGPLLRYVEDVKNNEQSRMDACMALAWVGTEPDLLTVVSRIRDYAGPEASDQFRRACLLETLITRPTAAAAKGLLEFMTPETPRETRRQVARAIGRGRLPNDVASKLFERMTDEAIAGDVALALMLGGTPELAARTVAMYGGLHGGQESKAWLEELEELWYRSFGYWSTNDLEQGRIFDWVDNAIAISHVKLGQKPQQWAAAQLMKQFDNLEFDNGPHSLTRGVLRHRLWQMARTDEVRREAAMRTLLFMKEQGVLIALRDEGGVVGQLAQGAYHTLMNPNVLGGM